MMTGVKQETAISIGRQWRIIGANITDKELMWLSAQAPTAATPAHDKEQRLCRLEKKMRQFISKCEPSLSHHSPLDETDATVDKQPALILNGDALEMCLSC